MLDPTMSIEAMRAVLPPFPLECIPGPARELYASEAEAWRKPVEMYMSPFLAAASAAIGTGLRLEIRAGSVEFPVLWMGVIARSGTGKTPMAEEGIGPLRDVEDELSVAGPARIETNDSTVEAVVRLLKANPRGLIGFYDELGAFVEGMDRYRRGGGDIRFWLKAWSAGRHNHDRVGVPSSALQKGKIDSSLVKHAFVAIAGGIQPEQLYLFNSKSQQGTGLFERFNWVVPNVSRSRKLGTSPPGYKTLWNEVSNQLRELRLQERPATLHFTKRADTVFRDWYESSGLSDEDDDGPMDTFVDKMPRQVAKFAVVLHALKWGAEAPNKPVRSQTLYDAIALAEYYLVHGEEALRLVNLPGRRGRREGGAGIDLHAVAVKVHEHLETNGTTSRTDLQRLFHNGVSAEVLDRVLGEELADFVNVEKRPNERGAPLEGGRVTR